MMLESAATGLLLGTVAGLAPGPLLSLVLVQSLRHGPREGSKVALSPLLSDGPIILVALFLARQAARTQLLLGWLALAGAIVLLVLAADTLRAAPAAIEYNRPPRSWQKGLAINFLSPHPWLFWLTAGTSTLVQSLSQGWECAAAFIASFYTCLVGSKILIACGAGHSRNFLESRLYILSMRLLGLLLAVFALTLLHHGYRLLRT